MNFKLKSMTITAEYGYGFFIAATKEMQKKYVFMNEKMQI